MRRSSEDLAKNQSGASGDLSRLLDDLVGRVEEVRVRRQMATAPRSVGAFAEPSPPPAR
jgi:hypothetical protein